MSTEQSVPKPSPKWYHIIAFRKSLNLPKPNAFEDFNKESRLMSPALMLFDGAKADMALGLSNAFHVVHSFQLGSSQQGVPTYTFSAMNGNEKNLLQANMSASGMLMARVHKNLTDNLITKFSYQSALNSPQPRIQAEADYCGSDYLVSFKTFDPNILRKSGVFVANYVQSITKKLSAGVEFVYQKPDQYHEDGSISYALRYAGDKWVGSAVLMQMSMLNLSYHQRISDRVEIGTDFNFSMTEPRKESHTTIGGKVDFKLSSLRAQIDTRGKLATFFEHRLGPGVSVLFSGEIDHLRTTGKFGIGIQVEQ
ncbi:hypothetical protein ROZALSC1DRAFT_29893 [Rozella allomycis CSF55]|uniref:Porin domain-containing protein n=1 Tax=Rozella allomycis (strain CSF55) TaxID=988480 RepID=A0A075B299_ROZAC|nr:Porin domain-containing protein [Rozella allomycis CSF55]RKP18431.1 hypothetical protein ROZALSC1DRAFT_29893 [Rozella allomycis CSF55]|eukprot:EPZ36705.1 Porin domain-containing protein [Rozella allomycis CSF55]